MGKQIIPSRASFPLLLLVSSLGSAGSQGVYLYCFWSPPKSWNKAMSTAVTAFEMPESAREWQGPPLGQLCCIMSRSGTWGASAVLLGAQLYPRLPDSSLSESSTPPPQWASPQLAMSPEGHCPGSLRRSLWEPSCCELHIILAAPNFLLFSFAFCWPSSLLHSSVYNTFAISVHTCRNFTAESTLLLSSTGQGNWDSSSRT